MLGIALNAPRQIQHPRQQRGLCKAGYSLQAIKSNKQKIVKDSTENEAELSETQWKSFHRILPIEASTGQRCK